MLDIDPRCSRAILIGAGRFPREPGLAPLPAANNVFDVGVRLANPRILGIEDQVRIEDHPYPDLVEAVRAACIPPDPTAGFHCLFVYYAGHGLIDSNHALRLAASNTTKLDGNDNAAPFASLRQLINPCRAKVKVVVLDCCYAGRVVDAGGVTPAREWSDQDVEETIKQMTSSFTIAASHASEPAIAPFGARNTAFTAVLLEILDKGINNGRRDVTVSELFEEVTRRCRHQKMPTPRSVGREFAGNVKFVHNARAVDHKKAANNLIRRLLSGVPKKHPLYKVIFDSRDEFVPKIISRVEKWLCAEVAKDPAGIDNRVMEGVLGQPEFRDHYRQSSKKPDWSVVRESTVITISPNGEGHCHRKRTVRPKKPVRMMWRAAVGDDNAPLDGFGDIELRVLRDDDESDLPVVHVCNEPRLKEFLFFFEPPLAPNLESTHTVSWRWPRTFAPLIAKGQDTWTFQVYTGGKDPVTEVRSTFRVAEKLGRLSITNEQMGGGELEPKGKHPPVKQGYRTYTWLMSDVSNGTNATLGLKLLDLDGGSTSK